MNKTIKVAIVDDHLLIRQSLSSVIKSAGYLVHLECSNGQEFINCLDENNLPNVVLLDLKMPLMDGFETLKWLKKNYPGIKVLVVTGVDEEKLIILAYQNGANGYLLKNAHPDEIRMAIEEIMAKGYHHNANSYYALRTKMMLGNLAMTRSGGENVQITTRELAVLKLICEEKSDQEIAQELVLSPRTVAALRTRLLG